MLLRHLKPSLAAYGKRIVRFYGISDAFLRRLQALQIRFPSDQPVRNNQTLRLVFLSSKRIAFINL